MSQVPAGQFGEIMHAYSLLQFESCPYWMFQIKPNQPFRYGTVNSQGFRGAEPNVPKRYPRIIFVGDSVGFGVGATSDRTTIPGYLERLLAEMGHPVEVVNASQRAHTLTQHWIRTGIELLGYAPDLLLYFFGYADYYTLLKGRRPGFPIKVLTRDGPRLVAWRRRARSLLHHIPILRPVLDWRAQDRRRPERSLDGAQFLRGAMALVERIRVVHHLAVSSGTRAAFVLQPVPGYGARRLHPVEVRSIEEAAAQTRRYSGRDYRCDLALFYDAIRAAIPVLQREGIALFDLSGVFDQVPEPVYVDHIHNSDRGHEIQAKAICRFITERAWNDERRGLQEESLHEPGSIRSSYTG